MAAEFARGFVETRWSRPASDEAAGRARHLSRAGFRDSFDHLWIEISSS